MRQINWQAVWSVGRKPICHGSLFKAHHWYGIQTIKSLNKITDGVVCHTKQPVKAGCAIERSKAIFLVNYWYVNMLLTLWCWILLIFLVIHPFFSTNTTLCPALALDRLKKTVVFTHNCKMILRNYGRAFKAIYSFVIPLSIVFFTKILFSFYSVWFLFWTISHYLL